MKFIGSIATKLNSLMLSGGIMSNLSSMTLADGDIVNTVEMTSMGGAMLQLVVNILINFIASTGAIITSGCFLFIYSPLFNNSSAYL